MTLAVEKFYFQNHAHESFYSFDTGFFLCLNEIACTALEIRLGLSICMTLGAAVTVAVVVVAAAIEAAAAAAA